MSSSPQPDSLFVSRRFNGPPQSGNGGYVAGLLAAQWLARRSGAARPVEVTLRAPLPLETSLSLRVAPDEALMLMKDDLLLAEARGVALELPVPPMPAADEAAAAGALGRLRAGQLIGNAYLTCFGCGVGREGHDGLRIVPSPVGDQGLVASDWRPHPALADASGRVPDEIVWAALDCPAGIAWNYRLENGPPLVTGRMTVAIEAPVRVDEPHVVIGWPMQAEGRKLHAGSALFDAQGRVLARSRQLWIMPKG